MNGRQASAEAHRPRSSKPRPFDRDCCAHWVLCEPTQAAERSRQQNVIASLRHRLASGSSRDDSRSIMSGCRSTVVGVAQFLDFRGVVLHRETRCTTRASSEFSNVLQSRLQTTPSSQNGAPITPRMTASRKIEGPITPQTTASRRINDPIMRQTTASSPSRNHSGIVADWTSDFARVQHRFFDSLIRR
jgi:hypothetical protein